MVYNSAHDLPSFVELSNQIKGLKLLGFLLPKDQRGELKKLEAQLKEMGDTVAPRLRQRHQSHQKKAGRNFFIKLPKMKRTKSYWLSGRLMSCIMAKQALRTPLPL